MAERTSLRDDMLAALGQGRELTRRDLGADARLSAKGMTFETESWDVAGLGHLCVMRMHAFFGLMHMETAVLAPTCVDAPLLNLDWVNALGTKTQIAELYDTQLEPWPDASLAALDAVRDAYADLPEAPAGEAHWYDDILYPCSFHKKGKRMTERMSSAAQDFLHAYVAQLANTPACDKAQKQAKVQDFAERLFAAGGPAVDQVTKLFGEQTARRLIVQHMYGAQPLP